MSQLQTAFAAYKNGDFIIVTDDADRENEGDLMLLAEMATTEKVAFMVRHTTGILCVAMTQERARTLHLPLMVEENQDSKKTAFTVSVDYKVGLTPGDKWAQFDITVPAKLTKYIVNQGSICLDGISLTVGQINDANNVLTVWLIPETLERTNLSTLLPGDLINVEVDVFAKYVERLLAKGDK